MEIKIRQLGELCACFKTSQKELRTLRILVEKSNLKKEITQRCLETLLKTMIETCCIQRSKFDKVEHNIKYNYSSKTYGNETMMNLIRRIEQNNEEPSLKEATDNLELVTSCATQIIGDIVPGNICTNLSVLKHMSTHKHMTSDNSDVANELMKDFHLIEFSIIRSSIANIILFSENNQLKQHDGDIDIKVEYITLLKKEFSVLLYSKLNFLYNQKSESRTQIALYRENK